MGTENFAHIDNRNLNLVARSVSQDSVRYLGLEKCYLSAYIYLFV
jgi:hypothetical protein